MDHQAGVKGLTNSTLSSSSHLLSRRRWYIAMRLLFVPLFVFLVLSQTTDARPASSDRSLRGSEDPAQSRELQNRCSLNSNGFYGQAIGTLYKIPFAYQIVVQAGVTEALVNDLLLPQLDRDVARKLLPYLFDCSGTGLPPPTPAGDPVIYGVTQREDDILFSPEARPCIGSARDLPCFVIAGSISVFAQNAFAVEDAEALVKPKLVQLMQGSDLNSINLLIDDVQYIDEGFATVAPVPTPAPTFTRRPIGGVTPPPASTPRPTLPRMTPLPSLAPVAPPSGPTAPTQPTPTQPTPTQPTPTQPTPTPPTPTPNTPTPGSGPTGTVAPTPRPGVATIPPAAGPPTAGNAPTAQTPTSGSLAPSPQTSASPPAPAPSGVDAIQWWGWLLIAVGASSVLCCCFFYCRGRNRDDTGEPRRKRGSSKNRSDGGTDDDDENDDYVPPGVGGFDGDDPYTPPAFGNTDNEDDAYEPPAVGTSAFTLEDDDDLNELDAIAAQGGYGYDDDDEDEDEESEEEPYEDEEGEEEGDYTEGSYSEGQEEYDDEGGYDDEGYDDGEYDDGEGEVSYTDGDEQESYYEEDAVGGGGFNQGGWGTNF